MFSDDIIEKNVPSVSDEMHSGFLEQMHPKVAENSMDEAVDN